MESKAHSPKSQPPLLALTAEILYQAPFDTDSGHLPPKIIAPIPFVTLGVKNKRANFSEIRFMVDTGAEISAICMSLANLSGIPYHTKQRVPIRGVSEKHIKDSFLNKIEIEIGSVTCVIPCLIYDDGGEGGHAFLGRAGIFEKFYIVFKDWHVYITRKEPPRQQH